MQIDAKFVAIMTVLVFILAFTAYDHAAINNNIEAAQCGDR